MRERSFVKRLLGVGEEESKTQPTETMAGTLAVDEGIATASGDWTSACVRTRDGSGTVELCVAEYEDNIDLDISVKDDGNAIGAMATLSPAAARDLGATLANITDHVDDEEADSDD